MSFENMGKKKGYIRRKNCYFLSNIDIKNCFPSIYNNCPKTCQQT